MAEYPRIKTFTVPSTVPDDEVGDYASAKAGQIINSLGSRNLVGRYSLARYGTRSFSVSFITNVAPSYDIDKADKEREEKIQSLLGQPQKLEVVAETRVPEGAPSRPGKLLPQTRKAK